MPVARVGHDKGVAAFVMQVNGPVHHNERLAHQVLGEVAGFALGRAEARTMTIINLAIERERRSPHLAGKARCLACRHEWQAVAPTGATWLECPACAAERGCFVYPVGRSDPHWQCDCGNDLFHITPDGTYCPVCGVTQEGFTE